MQKTGHAFFVRRPRRLSDLRRPHLPEQERAFRVAREIVLPEIDYENLVTDLVADRSFIEENAPYCSAGPVWDCLLVRSKGDGDAVLVMPANGSYVGWAALTVILPMVGRGSRFGP